MPFFLAFPGCCPAKLSAMPPPNLLPGCARLPGALDPPLCSIQAIGISIWATSQSSGNPEQDQIRLGCGITLAGLAVQVSTSTAGAVCGQV